MPAASWRTRPARSMSLWLSDSASAGSSRSVGTSDLLRRIRLVEAWLLVGSLHAGVVDEPLHRPAPDDVGLEDLLEIRLLDTAVPDVVRVDDNHGAVAALGEAAGLVHAQVGFEAGLGGLGPQLLHELLDV